MPDKHETQVTKMIHKRSTAVGVSKKITVGLNMFQGTILTLFSDVDQDT